MSHIHFSAQQLLFEILTWLSFNPKSHVHCLFCVKEAVAARTGNEDSPCVIVPVTDEPLTGSTTTPPPLVTASKPGQSTYQKPPPLPPNVLYQPIIPYYVLPSNPVSGGSYVYGHGADNAGSTQGGGRLRPHSPSGASGFLPAPQWFLDLLRDKQGRGNQRGSLPTGKFDSTSSEMSSEEDSDGD